MNKEGFFRIFLKGAYSGGKIIDQRRLFLLIILASFSQMFAFAEIREGKEKWLSKVDPSSFSNPEDFLTQSIHLKWNVDFSKKLLHGMVVINFKIINYTAQEIVLDTRDIQIEKVICGQNGQNLSFEVGKTVAVFGEPLRIHVSKVFEALGNGGNLSIEIHYSTTKRCSGLQWLSPMQTVGKKCPYLFSQCESIQARSLVPCQDTPSVRATYTAEVSTPKELQALMSAVPVGEPLFNADHNIKIYRFEQKIPIPSYLIALAVGDLVGKEIGPRSQVWAEREVIDSAAFEFSDTEAMLKIVENLMGSKYIWGRYDILVLPPSFPFSGMENPCLTFVTPTLLVGDKSLVYVIFHELAHSWTGNLVTNVNWEHFWLNEGFTMFLERKVIGKMHGESLRQLHSITGWSRLEAEVNDLQNSISFTKLVNNLNGVDPEEAYSYVPYEKGYIFLYYLEETVGGPDVFDRFLLEYIQNNTLKSMDSNGFKSIFINYFKGKGLESKIRGIDWDLWFYSTGMPPVRPKYDDTLKKACSELTKRWLEWNPENPKPTDIPFKKIEFDSLIHPQKEEFLKELFNEDSPFPLEKVHAMEKVYEMNNLTNFYVKYWWIRLSIRAKDADVIPIAFQLVNNYGLAAPLRAIYKDLYAWEEMRTKAIQNFKENSKYLMKYVARMIQKELHIVNNNENDKENEQSIN